MSKPVIPGRKFHQAVFSRQEEQRPAISDISSRFDNLSEEELNPNGTRGYSAVDVAGNSRAELREYKGEQRPVRDMNTLLASLHVGSDKRNQYQAMVEKYFNEARNYRGSDATDPCQYAALAGNHSTAIKAFDPDKDYDAVMHPLILALGSVKGMKKSEGVRKLLKHIAKINPEQAKDIIRKVLSCPQNHQLILDKTINIPFYVNPISRFFNLEEEHLLKALKITYATCQTEKDKQAFKDDLSLATNWQTIIEKDYQKVAEWICDLADSSGFTESLAVGFESKVSMPDGSTPNMSALDYAIYKERPEIALRLSDSWPDMQMMQDGMNALNRAISCLNRAIPSWQKEDVLNRQEEVVLKLIEKYKDAPSNFTDNMKADGQSAVVRAFETGNAEWAREMLNILINEDAANFAQSASATTLLTKAVEKRHDEFASVMINFLAEHNFEALVSHGYLIKTLATQQTKLASTLIDLFVENKPEELVSLKSITGLSPLRLAIKKGNLKLVQMLLEAIVQSQQANAIAQEIEGTNDLDYALCHSKSPNIQLALINFFADHVDNAKSYFNIEQLKRMINSGKKQPVLIRYMELLERGSFAENIDALIGLSINKGRFKLASELIVRFQSNIQGGNEIEHLLLKQRKKLNQPAQDVVSGLFG